MTTEREMLQYAAKAWRNGMTTREEIIAAAKEAVRLLDAWLASDDEIAEQVASLEQTMADLDAFRSSSRKLFPSEEAMSKIIAAAKEAGVILYGAGAKGEGISNAKELERFYAIAFEAGRQAEREACAVVAETLHDTSWPDTIAAAIRARGDMK